MARYSEITDSGIIGLIQELYDNTGKCPSVEDVRKIAKCGNVRIMPILKQWKKENEVLHLTKQSCDISSELPEELKSLSNTHINTVWKCALSRAEEKIQSEIEENRHQHEKALKEIERLEIEVQSIADQAKLDILEARRKTEEILEQLGEARGKIEELERHLITSETALKASNDREVLLQAALTAEQERYHALALSLVTQKESKSIVLDDQQVTSEQPKKSRSSKPRTKGEALNKG